MKELPHSKSCFVCGSQNRLGLNLRFFTDGLQVESTFVSKPEQSGFFGVVHGGITATVLDEVMVWACAVRAKQFCFSAEMTVRYLAPVPIGIELRARGEMLENRRGRLFIAEGKLLDTAGNLLAIASAKYMPIRNLDPALLTADFEGTEDQLRAFLPAHSRPVSVDVAETGSPSRKN